MEALLLLIAIITGAGLLFSLLELIFGFFTLKNLALEPASTASLPSLSIILSALNEETHIEAAVTSLLELDYPNCEIIAINDRSTDATPLILERLQKKHPKRLKVFHIQQLPAGWLGKNHALHFASTQANQEWFLFTDADVSMKKDTLRRVMHYIQRKKLDHLTIFENHIRGTFWLRVLLLGHYITYSMVMKPWRVRYHWSKRSLGHGAFNLVSRHVYSAVGGHQAIAMECMDDLKLGEIIKKAHFKQDTVDGRGFIEKEWYSSLSGMVEGVKKNSFSYFKYRPLGTFLALTAALIFYMGPLAGVFMSGWVGRLNLINIFLTLCIGIWVAQQFRLNKCYAVFYPLSILILLYTVANSAIATYRNKGIIWRGTFYPLEHLKNKTLKS